MQRADVEIAIDAFWAALSVKKVLSFAGFVTFALWSRSELIPALEHVMLSIRTARLQDVPDEVMGRLSATLIPFGQTSSKLMIVCVLGIAISTLINWTGWLSHDWDRRIAKLKQDRLRKTSELEAEIARLELLSDKAAVITGFAKDLEVLADKVERLKLEASKPRKTKTEAQVPAANTAELFLHKPKGTQPPRQPTSQRPEF